MTDDNGGSKGNGRTFLQLIGIPGLVAIMTSFATVYANLDSTKNRSVANEQDIHRVIELYGSVRQDLVRQDERVGSIRNEIIGIRKSLERIRENMHTSSAAERDHRLIDERFKQIMRDLKRLENSRNFNFNSGKDRSYTPDLQLFQGEKDDEDGRF